MLSQTVLPFRQAATDEILTARAGLALFGKYCAAVRIGHLIDWDQPARGSMAG
jgi:hypothetical protein